MIPSAKKNAGCVFVFLAEGNDRGLDDGLAANTEIDAFFAAKRNPSSREEMSRQANNLFNVAWRLDISSIIQDSSFFILIAGISCKSIKKYVAREMKKDR